MRSNNEFIELLPKKWLASTGHYDLWDQEEKKLNFKVYCLQAIPSNFNVTAKTRAFLSILEKKKYYKASKQL